MEHTNDVTILKDQKKRKKKRNPKFQQLLKNPKSKGDSGQFEFRLNDVTSEYDPALMGREGSIKFNEMGKSDGIVGGVISAYNNLLLSCDWTLGEIKDVTPEEKKIQETLHEWFFDKNNFESQLQAILRMLIIGFSCFNKYYTPFQKDNSTYMMPVLLERLQKSIWRIDYVDEFIEQITSKGHISDIPFKDLVFFSFRQEGSDLRGTSLLRQAYYDWVDKKDIKLVAKKGITREMLGLPVGKVPKNVRSDSPEYAIFADLLEMISSRDYADTDDSVVIPTDYELTFLNSEFKIADIKDYLSYYDSNIAISVLAQFILLGQQGKGGSFSLGADQSDFFLDGLHYIVNYVCAQYSKYVIQPTVRSNWANVDANKFKLVGLNLDKRASEEFAKILNSLISSGLLKVQTSDEKLIREMYKLPEIDEKERAENENNPDDEPNNDDPEEDDEASVDEDEQEEEKQKSKSALLNMKPINIVEFWNTPSERNKYIDQEVEGLTKYSKASLQIIADKLLSSIRWQLSKGGTQAQGLKEIKLNQNAVASYKKNMGQRLSAITKKAWDNAQDKSKPHLENLAVNPSDLPSKTLTSFIINQSDLVVDKQVTDMRDNSLLIANTASAKGYGLDQTLAQVEKGMDDFIANGNNAELASTNSITQAASYGEMQYYKGIESNLWGYRYENVSPKTNLCQNLVGKVYRVGSIAMDQIAPPNHFRCKSYFEPIYKDTEKPEYDDYIPAPSILKEKTM